MGLKIKNIKNILYLASTSYVNVKNVIEDEDIYQFTFTHRNYAYEFAYRLHKNLGGELYAKTKQYVGTFAHPHGTHRQDCYEGDILDKQSFVYFLETIVNDWAQMHKVKIN